MLFVFYLRSTRQHKYIRFVGKAIGSVSIFVLKRLFFVLTWQERYKLFSVLLGEFKLYWFPMGCQLTGYPLGGIMAYGV